jgi:hypothetical protein
MNRAVVWAAAFVVGSVALVAPTHTPIRDRARETRTNEIARDKLPQPVRHQGAASSRTALDTTRFEFRATFASNTPTHVAVTEKHSQPRVAGRKVLADAPATLPASAAPPVLISTRMSVPAAPASVATIHALQRELKRLGCYSGQIDGEWGPTSRYAAATFVKAVNAKLPVDKPDEALLALASYHQGAACQRTSNITTASTTQVWLATVTTTGLPDRGVERSSTALASPYAPRLTRPPRIVRASGAHLVVDLTEVPEMPVPPSGEIDQRTQMALGAEPSASPSEMTSATRDRGSQQKRDAARRVAARNRQLRARKRASRERWMRQVVQSVNLSGS